MYKTTYEFDDKTFQAVPSKVEKMTRKIFVYADVELHSDGKDVLDGIGVRDTNHGEVVAHIPAAHVESFLESAIKLRQELKRRKLFPKKSNPVPGAQSEFEKELYKFNWTATPKKES